MPDEALLVPCKICGKKFEKVGFHVRKKHSMSMDDYRKLPILVQETVPTVAEEKPVAAETNEPIADIVPVGTTSVEAEESSEKSEKRPWYKKLFFGLSL